MFYNENFMPQLVLNFQMFVNEIKCFINLKLQNNFLFLRVFTKFRQNSKIKILKNILLTQYFSCIMNKSFKNSKIAKKKKSFKIATEEKTTMNNTFEFIINN